ncbi:rCG37133 [Rattus norvegicus]|uniref:RCG37133 n=1 Tax=Rattus norvegicus TaxID=10116 RepID=A6HUL5_RAT|nr:rCG37133 [Rattus norvegicus]
MCSSQYTTLILCVVLPDFVGMFASLRACMYVCASVPCKLYIQFLKDTPIPHKYTFEEMVAASIFHSIEETDTRGDLSFIDKAEAGLLLYYTISGNQSVGKSKLPPCLASNNTLGDSGGHRESSCFDVES